jgi:hypothetical protein
VFQEPPSQFLMGQDQLWPLTTGPPPHFWGEVLPWPLEFGTYHPLVPVSAVLRQHFPPPVPNPEGPQAPPCPQVPLQAVLIPGGQLIPPVPPFHLFLLCQATRGHLPHPPSRCQSQSQMGKSFLSSSTSQRAGSAEHPRRMYQLERHLPS